MRTLHTNIACICNKRICNKRICNKLVIKRAGRFEEVILELVVDLQCYVGPDVKVLVHHPEGVEQEQEID